MSYYTLSRAMAAIPHLPTLLGGAVRLGPPRPFDPSPVAIGWGRKRSYLWSARMAERWGIPCFALEDGFLRSVGLGRNDPPLSLVVDDLGIYFDATGPSRLEQLIAGHRETPASAARVAGLIAAWRGGRLSKYNHAREAAEVPPRPYVLVVDQTRGDSSIHYGLADAGSFRRMLEAAVDEHPDCAILLKVHPEVFAGYKQGHFEPLPAALAGRVQVLGRDVHAPGLLEHAEAVYTVTSQMGFEALLWGRPVRTFGMPFYAGWGLTGDDLAAPARRRPSSLVALAHAALVDYPRYLDPETGQRCQVEQVMAHLALQRRQRLRLPENLHVLGFSSPRRRMTAPFLAGAALHFHDTVADLPAGAPVLVWGQHPARREVPPETPVWTLEDGFLRSVGLGAEWTPPLSLALDPLGIYYDATRPSALENLLRDSLFDAALLARAARLRQGIVAAGLTKYNVGDTAWTRPADATRVILVPGQVEADASIRLGAPGIRSNLELLRAVRAEQPDAYIVYKPHPDVRSGLRRAGAGEAEAARHCDAVLGDVAMDALLPQVDEVHVLTSLAGFEALLRGKRVVTHGLPFYAGWGLTEDRCPAPRRGRRLSLDELVAGVLILYPVYVSRTSGRYTTPERALEELLAWRGEAAPGPWQRCRRGLLRRLLGWRNRLRGERRA